MARISCWRLIAAALALLWLVAPAWCAKRALVVGNDDYQHIRSRGLQPRLLQLAGGGRRLRGGHRTGRFGGVRLFRPRLERRRALIRGRPSPALRYDRRSCAALGEKQEAMDRRFYASPPSLN